MNSRNRSVRVGLSVLVASLALASVAEAAGITIFTAPDKTYQNTTNNPCVFYIHDCSKDPNGWPAPAVDTQNYTATPLTRTYVGADYTAWLNVVGPSFVLGYDINEADDPQTISNFTITFYGVADVQLGNYALAGPLSVPANANGNGYADYILAAGCLGTVGGTGVAATCSQYSPFLIPNGTLKIVMTYNMSVFNDGGEQVFAVPQPVPRCTDCGPVPEPATGILFVLGSGVAAVAYRLRQRRRA